MIGSIEDWKDGLGLETFSEVVSATVEENFRKFLRGIWSLQFLPKEQPLFITIKWLKYAELLTSDEQ